MPFISNNIINLVLGKDFRNEKETLYSSKAEVVEKLKSKLNIPANIFSAFKDAPIDNILLFVKNFKIEPEVLFSDKRNIMEMIQNDLNLPTLYLLNSNHNRFLDDILLFANINESYIAKDLECNEDNIKEIFLNKDISKGVLIFINDGQESDDIVNVIKNILELKNITYLKRLNACDVYLIN